VKGVVTLCPLTKSNPLKSKVRHKKVGAINICITLNFRMIIITLYIELYGTFNRRFVVKGKR